MQVTDAELVECRPRGPGPLENLGERPDVQYGGEGLSPAAAVAAVLRDNLHGLEIDGRCVQIAAFAVALIAWRIGGWQTLPLPHIAWVGAPPPLPKRDFVALAEGDAQLEYALAALHDLFIQAPLLGSRAITWGNRARKKKGRANVRE